MNSKLYTGACLCGKVRFEITGGIQNPVYCHCSRCRKAQGSAFASNGNVDIKAFKFISGETELTAYTHPATPDQTKYFCHHCGSPIMSKSPLTPNSVRIRLGSIESDITEKPSAHIFVSSKANWENIEGDLPQYDDYKPIAQE